MEELPAPFGWLHDARGNDPLTFVRGATLPDPLGMVCSTLPVYSYAELRSAVLQERERCAVLCEGTSKFLAYSGGSSVQDACASAIRNQEKP